MQNPAREAAFCTQSAAPPRARWSLSARQVNRLLEALLAAVLASGLASWAVGTRWSRAVVVVHGVAGLTLVVLAPAKYRRSVRAGLRRRRPSRFVSLAFSVLVVAAVALGLLHATGAWHGVGPWSALWTHVLVGFALIPVFVWHVVRRPVRTTARVDLDRRALLGGGVAVAAGAALYATTEAVAGLGALPGADRRFTGSHEVASFRPDAMPAVQWLDDSVPDMASDAWRLDVVGQRLDLDDLRRRATPVRATLDCTGGWWSTQSWEAVALDDLLDGRRARSIKVTSATGYTRLFPHADAGRLYLAVGCGGGPLQPEHGAPARLVAPGRRGFWWVKWVTAVDLDDRPWWMQSPFPLT